MRKSPSYQPITKDDDWFAGEDQTIEFTIYDEETRAVKNITGYVLTFVLALKEGAASVLTLPAAITSATTGVCMVTVVSSDTAPLAPKTYWYNLVRTNPGGLRVEAYGPAVLRGRSS